MAQKHEEPKKISFFESFFYEEVEVAEEHTSQGSFAENARQLREQKQEELKQTEKVAHEVGDWAAGIFMEVFHLTGTSLGNRLHDMFLGSNASDENTD